MNNNKSGVVWALIVGAVIIVVLAVAASYQSGMPNPSENGLNNGTAGGNTPGSGKATGPVFPSNALSPTPDITSSIRFVSPPAGDRWPQSSQNVISWNHGSGSTGQLYLVDATSKKIVGVILDQVSPDQTYYAWNTRDLYVSRTSATKITVPLGTYTIGFSFDQNHLPTVMSSAFSVVAPLPK